MTQLVKGVLASLVVSASCSFVQGADPAAGSAVVAGTAKGSAPGDRADPGGPGMVDERIDIEAALRGARISGFGNQIELIVPLPADEQTRRLGAIGRQLSVKGVCGPDGAPATPDVLFAHARRDLERMNSPQRGLGSLVIGESPRFTVTYDPLDGILQGLFLPSFDRAAQFVDAVLDDRVDITINLSTADLPGNVIGSAGSLGFVFNYDAYVRALRASSTRLPLLPFAQPFSSFLPLGSIPVRYDGSAVDTAETSVVVNATQIRAIFGNNALSPLTEVSIQLDSTSSWDYFAFTDWTVDPGTLSVVDVMVHEITHGLGFGSRIDPGGVNPNNEIAGLDVGRFRFTGALGVPGSPPVTLEQLRDFPRHGENPVFTDANVYARPGEGTMSYIELEGGDSDVGGNLLQPSHLAYRANFVEKLGMMDPVLSTGTTRGPAFWSMNDRGPIDDMGWKLINPLDQGGDCNGNGVPDIIDILLNGFRDADNDGRLDICETFYTGVSNAGSRPDGLTTTVFDSNGVAINRFQRGPDVDLVGPVESTTWQMTGFIFVAQPDEYVFRVQHNGSTELTIAGQRIIQSGAGSFTDLIPLSVPGYIQLEAGWHPFVMTVGIVAPTQIRLLRESRSSGGWGSVLLSEFSGTPFPDCNANGFDDAFDRDTNGNGIPDDCEPDCDNDGVPDASEFDRNGNGIPDDCEPRDISAAFDIGVAGTDADLLEFGTCNSPVGFRFDTEIAIWSADGTLIASNDDAPGQGCATELLSRLELTLPAGEYYIGIAGFNATFADDFFVTFRTRFTSGSYQLRVGNAGNAVGSVEDGEVALVRFSIVEDQPCTADLAAPFGTLNFFDVLAYLTAFNNGDPAADLANPFGTLNFFDVLAYLTAFNAGCP